jgi:hypothetical protein
VWKKEKRNSNVFPQDGCTNQKHLKGVCAVCPYQHVVGGQP